MLDTLTNATNAMTIMSYSIVLVLPELQFVKIAISYDYNVY
jgi:hypothetical protein